MANARNGNSYYVDATGTLAVGALAIASIILTSNGAAGTITLQDNTSPVTNKMTLKVLNGETLFIDFNMKPVTFSQGLVVSTLTTAIATIVFQENNR